MFAIIGYVIVIGSVVGGYAAAGGHLDVLWQPLEFLIIFGGALGAFLAGNPTLLKRSGAALGTFLKGPQFKADDYMELLGVLYSVFKLAKSKGDLALEAHVENPDESALFQNFPSFIEDHHSVEFLCDYLRMLTLGTSNAHEVAEIIDTELGLHHDEDHAVAAALQSLADATPALGIVAAVLGVIHTMGSITEPPEVARSPHRRGPGRYLQRYPDRLWFPGPDCPIRRCKFYFRRLLFQLHEGRTDRTYARVRAAGIY